MTAKKKTAGNAAENAIDRIITKQQMLALQTVSEFRARLAGMQFGGKRDVYQVAGYPVKLSFDDYWSYYCRDGIAGRIVDMPARTTWRTPPTLVEKDQNKDGTEFTKAFEKLAKRIKLWNYFARADRLAGVGRYSVLFIGTKGGSDAEFAKEITAAQADDILYLAVYNEKNATIEEWETDPSNERFGMPRLYKLRTANNSSAFKTKQTDIIVHASRCIHVAEDKLEDDVFGRPRLERVLNRLMDLDKVAASTGEAYWQQVTQILQAKIDKEIEISDAQLKDIDSKLGDLMHDLRRQFSGKGIELGWLTNGTTPNVSQVADFYFSLIAGTAAIPKRILFGSEMGELASTTDQENWLGMINERQEQFAEPEILRQFVDKLISWGALPTPSKDGDYQVNWVPLFEESDDEKAGADLKRAQIAQTLTPVGGNPRELVNIDADGRVKLIEFEADEPIDMLLPLDPTHPDNQEPPTPVIQPPGNAPAPAPGAPGSTQPPPGGTNA